MFFAIQKEVSFNLSCYAMARNNVSQAAAYMRTVVTNIITHSADDSTSLSLKDRCTNLAKAFGLLTRAPLLCIPLVNRATQFALRLLSPKSLLSELDSYPLKEIKIRYSTETFSQLVKEALLKKNTEEGRRVNKSDIDSLLKKYRLDYQDVLKILDSLREIQCSIPLKKDINKYSRNKSC